MIVRFVIVLFLVLLNSGSDAAAGDGAVTSGIVSVYPTVLPLAGGNITITLAGFNNVTYFYLGNISRSFSSYCYYTGDCTVNVSIPAQTSQGYLNYTVHSTYTAISSDSTLYLSDLCPNSGVYYNGTGCAICPYGAICPGGPRMWAAAGFWTTSESSFVVEWCNPPDRCLGGYGSPCAGTNTGTYCALCYNETLTTTPYRFYSGLCETCGSQAYQIAYGYFVFVIVLDAAILLLNDVNLIHLEFALATISYMSHIDALPKFGTMPSGYKLVFSILHMAGVDVQYTQLSCFLGPTYMRFANQYLANLVFAGLFLLIPPLVLLIAMMIQMTYLKRSGRDLEAGAKKEYYLQRMLRVLLSGLGFLYPYLIDDSLQMMFCKKANDKFLLFADQSLVCFEGLHSALFIVAFFIVFLLISYPVLLFRTAFMYMKSLEMQLSDEHRVDEFVMLKNAIAEHIVAEAEGEHVHLKHGSHGDEHGKSHGEGVQPVHRHDDKHLGYGHIRKKRKQRPSIFWGISHFGISFFTAVTSGFFRWNELLRLIINGIFAIGYFSLFMYGRPFAERWKNVVYGAMLGSVVVGVAAQISYTADNYSTPIQWITSLALVLISFGVTLLSIILIILSLLPENDTTTAVLKQLAGEKTAGHVGPTEMAAAVLRQRAQVVASTLSEGTKEAFVSYYVDQAGGPGASLVGPAIGVEQFTPDHYVFPRSRAAAAKAAHDAITRVTNQEAVGFKLSNTDLLRVVEEENAVLEKRLLSSEMLQLKPGDDAISESETDETGSEYETDSDDSANVGKPRDPFKALHKEGRTFTSEFGDSAQFEQVMQNMLKSKQAAQRASKAKEARSALPGEVDQEFDALLADNVDVNAVLDTLVEMFGKDVLAHVPDPSSDFWDSDDVMESLFFLFKEEEREQQRDLRAAQRRPSQVSSLSNESGSSGEGRYNRGRRSSLAEETARVKEYGRVHANKATRVFKEFNLSFMKLRKMKDTAPEPVPEMPKSIKEKRRLPPIKREVAPEPTPAPAPAPEPFIESSDMLGATVPLSARSQSSQKSAQSAASGGSAALRRESLDSNVSKGSRPQAKFGTGATQARKLKDFKFKEFQLSTMSRAERQAQREELGRRRKDSGGSTGKTTAPNSRKGSATGAPTMGNRRVSVMPVSDSNALRRRTLVRTASLAPALAKVAREAEIRKAAELEAHQGEAADDDDSELHDGDDAAAAGVADDTVHNAFPDDRSQLPDIDEHYDFASVGEDEPDDMPARLPEPGYFEYTVNSGMLEHGDGVVVASPAPPTLQFDMGDEQTEVRSTRDQREGGISTGAGAGGGLTVPVASDELSARSQTPQRQRSLSDLGAPRRRSLSDVVERPKSREVMPVVTPTKTTATRFVYRAVAQDKIDVLVGGYINNDRVFPPEMQFRRIDEGLYMFGTRRIKIKTAQGSDVLIVPGGGGAVKTFDQYVNEYLDIEVRRMQRGV